MKNIISILITLPLLAGCDDSQVSADTRSNILLIMADDMGYSDIGSFGSEISTPNLDSLAMGGLKMSNFHAAAACSPTRTMLLSGADSHRAGMGTMYNDQVANQLGQPGYEGYMNEDVVSISTLLQDAGYNTYMTGKWHLGYNEDQSPKARGFDQSFVLLQGGSGHFDDRTLMVDFETSWFMDNGKRTDWPSGYFSSEFYTDRMIDYMKMGEEDDKPFFGYLAYTAPHWPLHAPDDYIDKYAGQYDDGYAALTQSRLKSMQNLGIVKSGVETLPPIYPEEENWQNLSDEQKKVKAREMEIYAAMVDNMDYHIGRVIDYLEKSGQRENTIIIFMSDNGAAGAGPGQARAFPKEWIEANFDNSYDNMGKINSYIYYGPHWAQASSAPSRLFKGFPTQGGIKVPAIINYRGKIGGREGQFSDEFMTILDLAPTFLELAGAEHPGTSYKGRDVFPHIGTSAVSFINGSSEILHDENDVVAWELNSRIGLRKGDWKLVKIPGRFGTGEWELFNMIDDPGETNDLSAENSEKLAELTTAWEQYVVDNGVIMAAE